MNVFGFYVGHDNYWPHAELLISSIEKHFLEYEIRILVNNALDQNIIKKEQSKLRDQYRNVTIECIHIPEAFKKVPFADKITAASIYESYCEDSYIWLDVDSYFFKSFDCHGDKGIQLNPVDQKNIGIVYGTPFSELWQSIFSYFDLEEKMNLLKVSEAVKTTVSKELIYPYYNIGFVVVNKNKKLFQRTLEALEILLESPEIKAELLKSPVNKIFMHQAVFSAAVLKYYCTEEIVELPIGVNYPMHFHYVHPNPMALDEIIHMRYDTFFEDQNVPDSWESLFSKEKKNLKMIWYY